jgi:predicted transcriptional regulator
MTSPITAVKLDSSVENCLTEMEAAQVRRMLVIDGSGALCGVVAQADVALKAPERETGALVKDLSQPTAHASNVH